MAVPLEPLEPPADPGGGPAADDRAGETPYDDLRVPVLLPTGVAATRPRLLHDAAHRHALRTGDQVCPWLT